MKNKKKKRKGFNASSMRCSYCGSPVVFRSADGIYHDNSKGTMLYVCSHYPQCDCHRRISATWVSITASRLLRKAAGY